MKGRWGKPRTEDFKNIDALRFHSMAVFCENSVRLSWLEWAVSVADAAQKGQKVHPDDLAKASYYLQNEADRLETEEKI